MTGIDFYLQVSWRKKEAKASESTLTSVGEEGGSVSGIFAVFSQQKFLVVTFWVHWWHPCPYFSLSFQVRVVGEGMQLVQPVYVTQVLVSYLLFPFHLWKDGRNVNKKQGQFPKYIDRTWQLILQITLQMRFSKFFSLSCFSQSLWVWYPFYGRRVSFVASLFKVPACSPSSFSIYCLSSGIQCAPGGCLPFLFVSHKVSAVLVFHLQSLSGLLGRTWNIKLPSSVFRSWW